MCVRTYKDQFEEADVHKIEHVFDLVEQLKKKKNVLRFYCHELRCALTGGSVLGSLLIAFSIMEMFTLDNYVSNHFDDRDDKYYKAIYELEKKKIHINELLDESVKLNFIENNDARRLKDLYKEYRIPLGHGLRTKGLYNFVIPEGFIKVLGFGSNNPTPATWKEMETVIEDKGINIISEILEILVK